MKRLVMLGAAIGLLAGGAAAWAQVPPPPGGPDGPGPHGPGPHGEWGMMDHHHHPEHEGTAFRFKRGDAEIDVRCSEQEPVQQCVAAAGVLLDKINSLKSPSAGSTGQ